MKESNLHEELLYQDKLFCLALILTLNVSDIAKVTNTFIKLKKRRPSEDEIINGVFDLNDRAD